MRWNCYCGWTPDCRHRTSAFLKQLIIQDGPLVKERLRDQASTIGVPINQLLDCLAASVPGLVSAFRDT
jgi:hypothetical protein